MFTKDEIKAVATLWNEKSLQEIANELNITTLQVQYLAKEMRREGFLLPKKYKKGVARLLIREVFESGEVSVI